MPDCAQHDRPPWFFHVHTQKESRGNEKGERVDVESALADGRDQNSRSQRAQHFDGAVTRVGQGIGARERVRPDDTRHKCEACRVEDGAARRRHEDKRIRHKQREIEGERDRDGRNKGNAREVAGDHRSFVPSRIS